MTGNSPTAQRYQIDDLTLDVGQRRLLRRGETLPLPRISFDFLRVLVEAAPNMVGHDEIARRVWGPDRIVTQENLTQRLLMVRQSLGDRASRPRYIESVRGQGYRLIPVVVRLTSPAARSGAAPDESARGQDGRRRVAGAFGVGILGLLAAIGLIGLGRYSSGANTVSSAAGATAPSATRVVPLPDSIALLPFEKLNAEAEPGYFPEALHAELVDDLGRRTDLNVISRTSVLHYADRQVPIGTIARELRVGSIVSGTVRYEDDVVHIIAELIDTDTGLSRWSSHYAVETDELFAVRLRMIEDLAGAIGTRLSPAGNATAESDPDAAEAYAFYLRAMDIFGQDYLGNRTTARTLLDQAIALDPDLAYAYAGKAVVHVFSAINSGDAGVELSVAEHAALAHDYIEHALGIEPQTDLAHYAAGVLEMFSWNFPAARESLSRAVEITPQHGTFLAQLGWLEVCGLGLADGLRHAERAAMIDPQNAYVFERLSATLNCAGDLPAALAATERALSLDPTLFQNQLAQAILTGFVHGEARGRDAFRRLQPMLTEARLLTLPAVALAYSRLGLDDDARRLFERFSAAAESRRTGPANWYMAYLAVADYDRAYEMLAQAIADRHLGPGFYTLMSFLNNPGSPAPFDEPRFLALRDALRASARVAGLRTY